MPRATHVSAAAIASCRTSILRPIQNGKRCSKRTVTSTPTHVIESLDPVGGCANLPRNGKYAPESHEGPEATRDKALFRAYLNTTEVSLHIRRTLDQFFYHNIDTKQRDSSQVIHRYQDVVEKSHPSQQKVLMVDQLWMWILGKKLVITSFPQRWKQPKKDPLNVLESILTEIHSGSRERVRSVYELAMIISGSLLWRL